MAKKSDDTGSSMSSSEPDIPSWRRSAQTPRRSQRNREESRPSARSSDPAEAGRNGQSNPRDEPEQISDIEQGPVDFRRLFRSAVRRSAEPAFDSFQTTPYWRRLSASVQQELPYGAERAAKQRLSAIYPVPSPVQARLNEKRLVSMLRKAEASRSQSKASNPALSLAFLELFAEAEHARDALTPGDAAIDEVMIGLAFAALRGFWRSPPFAGPGGVNSDQLYEITGFSERAALSQAPDITAAEMYLTRARARLAAERGAQTPVDTGVIPVVHNDRPAMDADVLGVGADARALARLILLKTPGPPLAIGLFGDWGSGKSTFMQRIETEATKLADAERAAAHESRPDTELFVQNVVQIRFNAWHYAEADLWSSIAAHIFRSLFEAAHGDAGRRPDWLDPAAFKTLLEDLAAAKAGQAGAQEEARVARSALASARIKADVARRRRDLLAAARDGDPDAALALVKSQTIATLDENLRMLGLAPALGDARRFAEAARSLRTAGGRLKAWLNATSSARGLVWTGCGLIAGLLLWAASQSLGLAQSLATLAPVVGASCASIARAWRAISPVLKAAEDIETEARKAADKAEDELAEAEQDRERAETKLAQAERRRRGLEALADADDPEAALSAFLQARLGEGGYHDRLGVVSRLHADFDSLSKLLAGVEDKRVRAGAPGRPKHLQRIVLYIDDLDRCRDDIVIKVLEAVHLLLALPLFVVVVGVDARWLEGALARAYRDQLGETGAATPSDYLEKIFQLPYWLPKLDTGGEDESGYAHPIDTLLGAPGARAGAHEKPETDTVSDGDEADGTMDWRPLAAQAQLDRESVRRSVELTDPERACMKALGPLVGKSPRAVKRFVNSYLFVKARMNEAELAEFLDVGNEGQNCFLPSYPAVMFALALDISASPELNRLAREAESLFNIAEYAAEYDIPAPDSGKYELGDHDERLLHTIGEDTGGASDTLHKELIILDQIYRKTPDDLKRPLVAGFAQLRTSGALPRLSFRRPY